MKTEEQIRFKINGIDSVDLPDYISAVENFADVIKEAALVAGCGEVKVKIKPVRKGSVDTNLVIESLNVLGSPMVSGAVNLATIITMSYGVIQFCRGQVNKFRKKQETVVYSSDAEGQKEVPMVVHRVIQNPIIQIGITNSISTTLGRMKEVESIEISDIPREDLSAPNGVVIEQSDKPSFHQYKNTELEEEYEETSSLTPGLYVHPVRGSYSGENTRYTFRNGQAKYYPTTINDEDFRAELESGRIKLFSEDLIKVDLTTVQRFMPSTQRTMTTYSIERVHEYKPKNRLEQTSMTM